MGIYGHRFDNLVEGSNGLSIDNDLLDSFLENCNELNANFLYN